MQGTVLKRSTAYHPQTDGQTEVVNRSLETYLRCFISETPRLWAKWLSWAEYWYNTSFHSASRMTPFKVLYGRDPPHLVHYGSGGTAVSSVEQYLEDRDRVLVELKNHLIRAQQIMKAQADGHRKEVCFEIGEWVYLKLRPYRQKTVAQRKNEKLAPRYYGPFIIEEKVGAVAYRLKLPITARIHPVFHVSQLKKAVGDYHDSSELPETLTDEFEIVLEPQEVRGVRQSEQGVKEVLLTWKGLPDHDATWESYDHVTRQFPSFHLEDKVNLREGSIDGPAAPPVHLFYRRRRRESPAGGLGGVQEGGGRTGG